MRALQLRDPDPTRAAILLGWARLALYVVTIAAALLVGSWRAWCDGTGQAAPLFLDGIDGVLKYLGAGAGATALANFTWTKPTARHRQD